MRPSESQMKSARPKQILDKVDSFWAMVFKYRFVRSPALALSGGVRMHVLR